MRKTKIVCTLGPASDSEERIRELMLVGMNVARFNFSHGSHEEHKKKFDIVKQLREELDLPIAILLDTKGPEIRLGTFAQGKAEVKAGDLFTLTTQAVDGDASRCSITFPNLPGDVSPGSRILIDDGLIELKVVNVDLPSEIICKVVNGGVLGNRKGVNVPGVKLSMPYLSDKDYDDIVFGINQGADFIAASFTRSAQDILDIRKVLDQHGCHWIKIIAKIENMEGVENIDEILRASDGIMVARGDMGVEIPLEDVPVIQKALIKKAYTAGKQVITATQMLDSMMKNPRPTRAEATDVANAIYDGTSAIMLSGETAAGLYPIEAVRTMSRIAERTELDIDYRRRFSKIDSAERADATNAISHATCTTAYDLGAAAIITVTKSGRTARMISKYRPSIPIVGCTTDPVVCRQMNLSWGVTPLMVPEQDNADGLFECAVQAAQREGMVENGDLVVITAGVPLGISGTTNLLKVHIVGDVLVTGISVNQLSICGNLCVAANTEEAFLRFKPGDILVIPETSNELLPLLKQAGGIITEAPGINSHAAVVGMALDIPVIVDAAEATRILKNGMVVTLDAARGIVCNQKD
ncbi:MAG: pyruvate kinase [Oscillospiraceae bacterium]|nr:pyruvate kinase [Oscillospiraceae bacterium]